PLRRRENMRPRTLATVAETARAGEPFDQSLANFLDQFYSAPQASALADPPALLASTFGDLGRIQDSYLAATADELSRQFHFPLPVWAATDSRTLHEPWFASSLASLRAILLWESPAGFRSRNLFVSANALSRV
ncbi:MAG: hypothetical protein ABI233_08240, partial [Chthoniobacterales bacterium]